MPKAWETSPALTRSMYELIEAANDKEERQLLEVERRAELGDRIDAAFVAACATARVERLAPASQSSI